VALRLTNLILCPMRIVGVSSLHRPSILLYSSCFSFRLHCLVEPCLWGRFVQILDARNFQVDFPNFITLFLTPLSTLTPRFSEVSKVGCLFSFRPLFPLSFVSNCLLSRSGRPPSYPPPSVFFLSFSLHPWYFCPGL